MKVVLSSEGRPLGEPPPSDDKIINSKSHNTTESISMIAKKIILNLESYLIAIIFRIERSAALRTSSSRTISGCSFSNADTIFSKVTIFI